nr:hypothetical protein [Tanacetum cinerariifolium]
MSAAVSDAPLSWSENKTTLLNAAKEYDEEVKGKDAQVSGEGLVSLNMKKSSTSHQTSKNMTVALCKCSSIGRPLGAYNLGVETPKALVYVGVMTSGDARSWYMISGDAKSWV